ncbi:hypothetical protein B0I32_110198 [Nonomuraea fuscirosea]|uniref:Uncharacterized protein n=1 Tax=Nonomuraea fuscirosea TaxID=1291556 RepID=A0A2T0MXD0_9ACTN|nr:hypothetical protein [Nonomuraea fuscirosea]PRX63746.1 hypothetical protein B0I32_110198 [Nonomuraea fuscirosea]
MDRPATHAVPVRSTAQVLIDVAGEASHELVVAGAAVYNVLTQYLMKKIPSRFEFIRREADGERGIRIGNFHDNESKDLWRGVEWTQTFDGEQHPFHKEYFVVERLKWDRGKDGDRRLTTVFIAAGTCSAATAEALRLLADWPALARSFGDKNFGLVREIHLIATNELDGRSREMAPPHEGAGFEFRYGEH